MRYKNASWRFLTRKWGEKVFLAQQSENTVCTRKQATMASDWYPSLPHKTWLSLAPGCSTLISTRRLGDPLISIPKTRPLPCRSRDAHLSAHTTTLVNQCSADLMSQNCVHKTLPNRSPFAFWNSLTMFLQNPTSIRSGNTLPTPCILLLGKGWIL